MNLGGGHNSTHGRDPPLPIHPEAARPSSPTGEVTFPALFEDTGLKPANPCALAQKGPANHRPPSGAHPWGAGTPQTSQRGPSAGESG